MTAANYGLVKGSAAAGMSGGTGGRETLSELGLVPQSVLLVRWEDEGMNGVSLFAYIPSARGDGRRGKQCESGKQGQEAGEGAQAVRGMGYGFWAGGSGSGRYRYCSRSVPRSGLLTGLIAFDMDL